MASLRESSKIFYYVYFIEYANFNNSKKVSFYFGGVGKRWRVIRKVSIVLEELMNAAHLCVK
jgi:hypothetical protein